MKKNNNNLASNLSNKSPYVIWVKVLQYKGLNGMNINYYVNMKTMIKINQEKQ